MAKTYYLGGIFTKGNDDKANLHSLYTDKTNMEITLHLLKRRFPNIRWIWSSNHAPYNLKPDDSMIINLREQALANHEED